MRRHRKIPLRKILYVGAFFALLLVMLLSAVKILEATVLRGGEEGEAEYVSKTILRDGVEYFPRQDITVFLVLGIDRMGKVEQSDSYNNHGAADLAMLLVFDETEEELSVLHLNRDTMLTMPVIGIGGKQAGTYYGQLALAHTYGTGLKDSCENTKKAISDFLYGIRIDYYVSMNMDAIPILNDAVGGVTVEVTEDFSAVDPSIGMGQVTLRGDQALNYVRTRKDVGDQLNLSRIQRQKQYLEAFAEAFRIRSKADGGLVSSCYHQVEDYLVSDCSVNSITGMIERYEDYEITRIVSPEGENVLGEKYFEFYVDEDSLDSILLQMFYAPKA